MKVRVTNTSVGTIFIDTTGLNKPENVFPVYPKQTIELDIESEERLAQLKQQVGSSVSFRKLSK